MISGDFFSVANNLGDSVAFNLESDNGPAHLKVPFSFQRSTTAPLWCSDWGARESSRIQSAVRCVWLSGDKAFPGSAPGSPLLLVRELSNGILPDYSRQSLQPSGLRRPRVACPCLPSIAGIGRPARPLVGGGPSIPLPCLMASAPPLGRQGSWLRTQIWLQNLPLVISRL